MGPLLLIDGNNLLYRIIKAKGFPTLTTQKGEPTGPVFGVLQSIHKIYNALFPSGGVMVFDGGLSARRQTIFPTYKDRGADPKQDDDEARQLFGTSRDMLTELLAALGMGVIRFPDREADDVLLQVAHQAVQTGRFARIVILSEDMDLCQIIQCSEPGHCEVELQRPIADLVLSRANIDEHLGYPLAYYKWYKALVGKTWETNGLPGIGKKTAITMIKDAVGAGVPLIEVAQGSKTKRYQTVVEKIKDFYIGVQVSDLFAETFTDAEVGVMFEAVINASTPVPARYRGEKLAEVEAIVERLEFYSILDGWPAWARAFIKEED